MLSINFKEHYRYAPISFNLPSGVFPLYSFIQVEPKSIKNVVQRPFMFIKLN